MSNEYINFLRGNSFGSEDDDDITQAELDAMSPEEREFIQNMREITAANLKMAKEISSAMDLTSKDKWGEWTGKLKRDLDPSKMVLTKAERRKARMEKEPKKSKRKGKGKAKKKGSVIPIVAGVGAGVVVLGTTIFLVMKKRKNAGSLSEKPIDFLSRKKELESQGRIPGRITEVRGPFAPAVQQQVPFQGQAQIIDLGAQMASRLGPIRPVDIETLEASAMNTFPQLMNQLGSPQGNRKLDQIAQINAQNTMALLMDIQAKGRKISLMTGGTPDEMIISEYTLPEVKELLKDSKFERKFIRHYGRVFTSAIKRFDV